MAEALGQQLTGDLPDNVLVIDVLLIAKVLDGEGEPCLVQMVTPGLTTWEATGMAQAMLDQLRRGMHQMFEPDE